MGLEISKCYSSYSFHLISKIFHEDIAYQSGMQAVTFPGNLPSFEKFVKLCNFNVAVNGKVLKC